MVYDDVYPKALNFKIILMCHNVPQSSTNHSMKNRALLLPYESVWNKNSNEKCDES